MGFPDVSSFPCTSPYRGCGGWQFGNRIHHLMRSFHPSIINIAEGSIFRPPGGKNFEKLFQCSSGLRPAPSRSGKQKVGPFMGRLRANFARLGNPMQDCHLGKELNVTCFPIRPIVILLLEMTES